VDHLEAVAEKIINVLSLVQFI